MNPVSQRDFPILRAKVKLRLLQMHYESSVGHIGGNLSCLDIMLCLFHHVLTSRDRFVLSKGHAAGALYVTLWSLGRMDENELTTFHRDGTLLTGHPCHGWHEDIVFTTGSLGHGLSLSAGMAWIRKCQGREGNIYCLASDGDLNEGSTWEASHLIPQHCLSNLTVIVDFNRLQAFGSTNEILRLGNIGDRLTDLGWQVFEINGHEPDEILRACTEGVTRPRAVIARTMKGKGVSFMENRMEWHYLPMSEKQYRRAVGEILHDAPITEE